MRDLVNKVVVISGAGSGIGLATAQAFAQKGARVHLVDIDGQRLDAAAEKLSGFQITTHLVDCRDGQAVRQLAEAIYKSDGRVDILHNNAGVCCGGPVSEISLEDWHWSVDVNLWGVIHSIRAFVPRMIEQGGPAHIINTASMAGLVGLPYVAPYCATKFAVVGLSESLAAELAAYDIRVTTVCPGAVATNVLKDGRVNLPGKWFARIQGAVARFGSNPDDVAADILAAVRSGQSLKITAAGSMLPLWVIKRTSQTIYDRMNRLATRFARKL
jgi:NAD(P)-dependent dehydrogenase (short-subunit alcohol dehydrogenase family)